MDSRFFAAALAAALSAAVSFGAAAAERDDVATGGLGQRDVLIAAFDRLPLSRLEAYFMACDRAASDRLMAMDEGARCAMAWDTLLRRRFDGNVTALLAWWRAEKGRRVATD
jgi:hypothetical protein